MKPWDPRLQSSLFSAASEQLHIWNQTWNRLLKLLGEGPAVNGRREGLRSNAIALYSLQNATARESPLTETFLHLGSCLREESASVGQSSFSIDTTSQESSVEALGCAFKSLNELNNYWLLASASSYAVQLLCKHIWKVHLCQALCVWRHCPGSP